MKLSQEIIDLLEEYKKTLTDKEIKACYIAEHHLGSTFQLEKSVGFLQWMEIRNKDKDKSNY